MTLSRIVSIIGRTSLVKRQSLFGFEPLAFPRRQWVDSDYSLRYRVYGSPTDFEFVIADSAKEAFKISGLDNPYKVVRGMEIDGVRGGVISKGRLVPSEEPAASPEIPEQAEPGDQAAETGEADEAEEAGAAEDDEPSGEAAETAETGEAEEAEEADENPEPEGAKQS